MNPINEGLKQVHECIKNAEEAIAYSPSGPEDRQESELMLDAIRILTRIVKLLADKVEQPSIDIQNN